MDAHAAVALVGFGYVGLHYGNRIYPTGDVAGDDLKAVVHLEFGTDPKVPVEADVVIVAMPTPVRPSTSRISTSGSRRSA
jgi:UDP-N-acetyl-D-mannosaminuronate dehydrogenase